MLPDTDILVVGGVGASCTSSQAPQHVPKGVPAQQVLVIGVCSLGDGRVDPVFESHHVFVAGGQDSRGDEDAAQVLDCLPGGQLVECLVCDGASGELTQHLGRGASVEPRAERGWPLGGGQRAVEHFPVGRDGAGVVGEQFV